jgi:hypothetical protein
MPGGTSYSEEKGAIVIAALRSGRGHNAILAAASAAAPYC